MIRNSPEVVSEKLRLAAEMDRRPLGDPSLYDQLLEDRRRERERELAEEGW
jgi:hypothetical protein